MSVAEILFFNTKEALIITIDACVVYKNSSYLGLAKKEISPFTDRKKTDILSIPDFDKNNVKKYERIRK